MALALNESESAESEADSGEKSCRRTPCAPGPWEPEASTRDVSEAPAHGLEAAAHAVRLLLRAIRLPLLVAGIVAVVAACFLTGYWPVIRGQRAMRLAIWDAPEREAHLREAVAADPWAAEPRIELAGHLFQVWRATGSPGALAEFERVKEEALQRAPRAADAWHYFAGLYREAFEVAGERRLLEKAVEAYRQTVELYPNHATYRADLAEALRAAGDDAGFRAQKAEALRLDAITPHEDKKLQPEQRRRIEKEEARSEQ
jgi:tetratricopeptide (TPR) repeat protein